MHAVAGAVAGASNISLLPFGALLVSFELFEHAIESPRGSKLLGTKRPETQVNVATDLAAALAVYALTRHALSPSRRRR